MKGKLNVIIVSEVYSKYLIIDEADRLCEGVTVIGPSGSELGFYATRGVILSQGVFESPKLLMLSGIGPALEQAKHGIPVIVDSRHVGQHCLATLVSLSCCVSRMALAWMITSFAKVPKGCCCCRLEEGSLRPDWLRTLGDGWVPSHPQAPRTATARPRMLMADATHFTTRPAVL